ncbi:suppressor of kinetochore protein mutant, partial [Perkinsus olseni]
MLAANYMLVRPLVLLCCAKIASWVSKKTPDDIIKYLGLPEGGLTTEQQIEQLRKASPWCSDAKQLLEELENEGNDPKENSFDDVRLEMRNSFEALPSSRSSSSATLYQGSTVYPPYRKEDVVASRRKKAERCADVSLSSRRPPLCFSRGRSDGDAAKWRPSVSTSRLWRHSNARHWYQGARSSYFDDRRSSIPQRRGKCSSQPHRYGVGNSSF